MPQPEPKVFRPSEIPAVSRGGGVKTIPLLTRKTGARSFINGMTIFPPRGSVPLHKHNCDESILVLEGNAVAEIAGEEHCVTSGDVTVIPEGVHHRFRNVSDSEEMKILWTYASVDADRTIIATGETRRIDDEHSAPVDETENPRTGI
ncbi:MAG TPA: cupin domain-containing protein [Sphingomicrobium sp.]|nr:cupin domain-containing protein [Sphingomicrobium sp.]